MKTDDRVGAMLDHALEMTFPASDPFTIYFPEIERDENASREEHGLALAVAA